MRMSSGRFAIASLTTAVLRSDEDGVVAFERQFKLIHCRLHYSEGHLSGSLDSDLPCA